MIGWASLVVLIAIFLPWESFSSGNTTIGIHFHFDGWTTGIAGWGGGALLAAAGEYLIARRLGYRLWAPPFGDRLFAAGLAAIGLVLVTIQWATLPTLPLLDSGPSYGVWIALAAGVVETVAAIAEVRAPTTG